jgi:nucleoside-diphosphate-sugar epimerase
VGRFVCRVLRERGLDVRIALRRSADPVPGRVAAEQVVVGDVGPDTEWAQALAGIEAVVHLAGLAHIVDSATSEQVAAYRRVNAEGTAALARAASERGVHRLVFVSSARVLGDASPGRPWTENDTPRPPDEYARSKWEAERELREIVRAGAMEPVILRPPLVYGPGVKANFLRLLETVDRGWPIPLGSVRNRRSFLYVGNLAHAIAACIDHPAAAGQTFLVSDGEEVSTAELIRLIAAALGRRQRLLRVPLAVLRIGATILGRSEDYTRLAADFALDSSRIRGLLGWSPPYSMRHGLEETARWYLSERDARR